MILTLSRFAWKENTILGRLYVDADTNFFSSINDKLMDIYTLEDKDRNLFDYMTADEIRKVKIAGKTAIPYGRYKVGINISTRFGKLMPILFSVKGFSGVRIHNGSFAKDTEGCILIGYQWHDLVIENEYMISKSKECFKEFYSMLNTVINKGEEIYMDIVK